VIVFQHSFQRERELDASTGYVRAARCGADVTWSLRGESNKEIIKFKTEMKTLPDE
jgi:hypothetical protein